MTAFNLKQVNSKKNALDSIPLHSLLDIVDLENTLTSMINKGSDFEYSSLEQHVSDYIFRDAIMSAAAEKTNISEHSIIGMSIQWAREENGMRERKIKVLLTCNNAKPLEVVIPLGILIKEPYPNIGMKV